MSTKCSCKGTYSRIGWYYYILLLVGTTITTILVGTTYSRISWYYKITYCRIGTTITGEHQNKVLADIKRSTNTLMTAS